MEQRCDNESIEGKSNSAVHRTGDLDLPPKQKALCISDVYKANQDKELLTYMDEKGIKVVFVPVACTDRLQPLDVQINGKFKSLLNFRFSMQTKFNRYWKMV